MRKKANTDCQIDFITGKFLADATLEAAKKVVIEAGYKLVKVEITTNVDSVPKLVTHFYGKLFSKYPKRISECVQNRGRDVKFASLFLESRMKDGNISKSAALQECVDIIDTIFDFEEEFGFKFPIRDITVLGQVKAGWITQKAIDIMNKEKTKKLEREATKVLDEIEENAVVDLEDKSNLLQQMLKNMEV